MRSIKETCCLRRLWCKNEAGARQGAEDT